MTIGWQVIIIYV